MQEAFKKRMAAKGLQFSLPDAPLTVAMEDEIIHTVDFPICSDPDCCCHRYELEKMQAEYQQQRRPARRSKRLVEANYEDQDREQGFRLLR